MLLKKNTFKKSFFLFFLLISVKTVIYDPAGHSLGGEGWRREREMCVSAVELPSVSV